MTVYGGLLEANTIIFLAYSVKFREISSVWTVRTDGPYGRSVRTVRTDGPYGNRNLLLKNLFPVRYQLLEIAQFLNVLVFFKGF